MRWSEVDLEAGRLAVRRALIPSGDDVIVSQPKTAKGLRVIALDTYAHAIPALQEEEAALIAGLVFAAKEQRLKTPRGDIVF